jgi:hypothetical protein
MSSAFRLIALATTSLLFGFALFSSAPGSVPLTVEASEDASEDFPDAPRLQSFASANLAGKWVLIGGRTNGYHQSGGKDTDFSRLEANRKIWVIDTVGAAPHHVYSYPVSSLPDRLAPVKDQWTASNLAYSQDRDTLYIAGGYGESAAHQWVTYPVLSVVSLSSLVEGVMHGKDFTNSISFTQTELVQSTGGDLLKLDNGLFYLVMGHIFMGRYTDFEAQNENHTPRAWQKYLGEIRKLRISRAGDGTPSVSLVGTYSDPEFRRRDLNVTYSIGEDGKTLEGGAYGGVFTKDQLNFTHPVYFGPKAAPYTDRAYEQKMSAYACAKLLIFDQTAKTMYTTFFGGISRWFWNYQRGTFEEAPLIGDKTREVYYDGLEWIDQISTLVHRGQASCEFVQPKNRLPAAIGSEAALFLLPGLKPAHENTNILDREQFQGKRTLVGYIYGGIRAYPKQFPYRDDSRAYRPGAVPTRCNDLILKVYVSVSPGG